MRVSDLTKTLLLVVLTATTVPATAIAKPNSYPGENSKFRSSDPAVIAQQKADRERRIELRKQRREERKRARQERRNSQSN